MTTPIIIPLDKTHRVEISRHLEGISIVQQNLVLSSTEKIWRTQGEWGLCLHKTHMEQIAQAILKLAEEK